MERKILNRDEILSHGDIESKKIIMDIAEQTLCRLDSYHRIKSFMSLEGDILKIGNRSWDLSRKKNIFVVGAGKACNHMALAVEEILGDRMTRGIAIVKIKEPERDHFKKMEVYKGGHPIPNEEGVMACEKIIEIVDCAGPDDLFITVISGGSTALMCCPVPGITLEEKKIATDVLLKAGANIIEINSVRRHLSKMNGGNLAKRIENRGAELIGIDIYDAFDLDTVDHDYKKPIDFFGTPIARDNTTLEDALNTIIKYNLENRLPANIVNYLKNCGPEGETPKSFPNFTYFVINTISDSCDYAREVGEKMGIPTMIFTTSIAGESREAGIFLASIAREIQVYNRPVKPPCVILCAGETTTQILDNSIIKGRGGPSQELAASFAVAAADIPGAAILSIDTEGTDGTTTAAGGITDSTTLKFALENGIDLYKALREHSTYEALFELRDLVITGNTGTNLCDLNVIYVPHLGK